MVTFQTNRYSVPVEHASKPLLLRAYVDRVEITNGASLLAIHDRCYLREQDILSVFHYLPLLRERPGAFDHAKPLKMWPRPAVLDHYLAELRERMPHRLASLEFLRVVELCVDHSTSEVAAAVEQAMTSGSLGAGTVSFLLRANRTPFQPLPPILATAPACPSVQARDLHQYDCLLRR
jgi:hypothetical protein